MDLKQIKELMASMEKAKMKRIHIKTEKGFEVMLERECEEGVQRSPFPPHETHLFLPPPPQGTLVARAHAEEEAALKGKGEEEKKGAYVVSPMVGTYYSASSPDDPPFVKVGDVVDENTIVCIIEAMKVMNEVKAGVKGTIAEILVENGHPLEFGTQIVRIV